MFLKILVITKGNASVYFVRNFHKQLNVDVLLVVYGCHRDVWGSSSSSAGRPARLPPARLRRDTAKGRRVYVNRPYYPFNCGVNSKTLFKEEYFWKLWP